MVFAGVWGHCSSSEYSDLVSSISSKLRVWPASQLGVMSGESPVALYLRVCSSPTCAARHGSGACPLLKGVQVATKTVPSKTEFLSSDDWKALVATGAAKGNTRDGFTLVYSNIDVALSTALLDRADVNTEAEFDTNALTLDFLVYKICGLPELDRTPPAGVAEEDWIDPYVGMSKVVTSRLRGSVRPAGSEAGTAEEPYDDCRQSTPHGQKRCNWIEPAACYAGMGRYRVARLGANLHHGPVYLTGSCPGEAEAQEFAIHYRGRASRCCHDHRRT